MSNQRSSKQLRAVFKGLSSLGLAGVLLISVQSFAMASSTNQASRMKRIFRFNNCGVIRFSPVLGEAKTEAKTAEDYLNKGLAELESGNYDLARANFDRALKLKPNYAEILLEKGFAALEAGDEQAAFDAFNNSLALKLDNPDAFFGRGKVCFRWNSAAHTQAIEDLTQAIQMKPDYAEAYFLRAKASLTTFGLSRYDGECYTNYLATANYDRAISDITRFLQLKQITNQNKSEIASAYAVRAGANLNKEFYNQAITDATQALQLDPTKSSLNLYWIRGQAYYAKREYVKAIAEYNRFLQIEPSNFILLRRAKVYSSLGNYDAAISDYNQVIKNMRFDDAQVYYDRGHAYALKGDKQKAIQDFEKVVKFTQDSLCKSRHDELQQKAKEQLQKLKTGVV